MLGFILLTPLSALPAIAAQILHWPALGRLGELLRENLLPTARLGAPSSTARIRSAPATGRWVLAVVLSSPRRSPSSAAGSSPMDTD